jgi:hypothetical protein
LDFDQDFGFAHYFDDFTHITARFMKQLELFTQKTDYEAHVRTRSTTVSLSTKRLASRIESIPLCFKTPQILGLLVDEDFCGLYLGLVIGFNTSRGNG